MCVCVCVCMHVHESDTLVSSLVSKLKPRQDGRCKNRWCSPKPHWCPDTSMHPVLGFDVEAAILEWDLALEQARTLRGGQIILPGCPPHQL